MKDFCEPFKEKEITLVGLGLLGRGVGDAEFLAKCGAELLVTDRKTEEQLAESIARLRKYPNVTFHLGGHRTEDFTNCDMVIKAAGVRLDSPEIAVARKAGVPVVMSTALFAKYAVEAGAIIVGVTGTRGKSTVAHMIYHSLIRANRETVLGGNVRGVSTLALLPQIKKGTIAVLELDSWQLQGFGDLGISPHVAIFTNLMPDHLNYYKSDMDAYFADKANIFRYQKGGDVLIVGTSVRERVGVAKPPISAVVPPLIPPEWKLKISGEHNRENASFAATALRALGVSESEIRSGLESFRGIEGRLQFMREIKGVKIYNDNNATTPEATIAGLKALDDRKQSIILIMGGTDKGLDMSALVREIGKRCKAVVFFRETGTDKIKDQLLSLDEVEAFETETFEDAVKKAFQLAKKGDTLLFSPAFASFGRFFKNEFDRMEQFNRLVDELK